MKPKRVIESRLIAPSCNKIDCGIEEYYLSDSDRVIRFHNRPDQFEQHMLLSANNIPCLDLVGDEASYNDFEIRVPKGAFVLSTLLKSIARDVEEYSQVFYDVGEYIAEIYKKCDVVPANREGRGLMDSLVIIPENSNSSGVAFVVSPPYCLEPTNPFNLSLIIKGELEDCGFYTDDQILTLLRAYHWGVGAVINE